MESTPEHHKWSCRSGEVQLSGEEPCSLKRLVSLLAAGPLVWSAVATSLRLQHEHTDTDSLLANRSCENGQREAAYLLILRANARRSGSDAIGGRSGAEGQMSSLRVLARGCGCHREHHPLAISACSGRQLPHLDIPKHSQWACGEEGGGGLEREFPSLICASLNSVVCTFPSFLRYRYHTGSGYKVAPFFSAVSFTLAGNEESRL